MEYLENKRHHPLGTRQCNYAEAVFSGTGFARALTYCPRDVWAELRVLEPVPQGIIEATQGFYCAEHFMKVLPVVMAVNRIVGDSLQHP